MIAAIHQPQYIPWIGYMNKIASADIFIFLDTVQFKKNEWQNRNRIKTAKGWQWMTVPVCYHYPEQISEIKINNTVRWGRKHWQTLITNYSQAPYFKIYADFFHDTYSRKWELLADLSVHITTFLADVWDLRTTIIKASQLEVRYENPTDRLVAICEKCGADIYLSGKDGPNYMNIDQFNQKNIKVLYQDFCSEVYPQIFEGFIPDLSSIDLLFNCGPEGKNIIENHYGRSAKKTA